MSRAICAVVVAIMLGAAGALAAQEAAEAPAVAEVKVSVRQYKTLPPADVYRAALAGIAANVEFRDAFAARENVPAALSVVNVRGAERRIVAAFRTQSGLLCLIPASSGEALRAMFGLPANRPLTPAILQRGMVANRGQQVTVRGALAGTGAGSKLVVVDLALLYEGQAPKSRRELHVSWRGAVAPVVMDGPGSEVISVPCTAKDGESVAVKVTVTALRPEELLAEVARATAELEGAKGTRKAYGEYEPGVVYRHATAENRVNVDFVDSVVKVIGANLPSGLATVPVLRHGAQVSMPVGYAFETAGYIVCLVPRDLPTTLMRAASIIPGERVRVRGTTVGSVAGSAVVAVDYVAFPDQAGEGRGEDVWHVTVEWPGTRPRSFWDYGLYSVVDLPCQHAAGHYEALQLLLGEFRTIKVPLAAQPAAQPEG